MNDKGTIVQQLEAEHDYLLEKIQKMQSLLERWLTYFESQQEHHRMTVAEFANIKEQDEKLRDDTKTLLKEAKE